ncbi:terminase small subunit [Rhizobium mongolense]|uniref:Phage terminase Nu1 subunit (DNA packaging protein) n=1 Tax=Rhizobium mongolense TaxID=57676 RepID=A0A7W6RRC6_9HYPH|nr:terminase small subunit [Rhizobium mongolense]MBB4277037.1 phage terminase Nu1 subunit (DNA packaging protein) [Rhizobium mongolense]
MTENLSDLTESQIETLIGRYPLPESVIDCVMTREELADAFATSLPTITEWMNKGMPVKDRGGQGKPYQLQLSHCWAWRQAWKASEDLRSDQVKKAQAAMRLALVGGSTGDSLEALDPKTRREILAVQIEQERFQRERNELLKREDVAEMLDNLFSMIRDSMESAPDRIERKETLPPKVTSDLVEICDEIVAETARRIAEFWSNRPVTVTVAKRELFDA